LQATLQIFSSGAQSAALAQARYSARQITAQRAAAADAVRARAQAALEELRASYPSIRLAEQAAAAARENFEQYSDAYARGLVTVTDLISAQDADLDSDLARAQAKYAFLIDFVTFLRAVGSFDLLLDPQSRASWYDRVDRWFQEHGGALPAH
jgi:outer membrane protein TolC